MARRKVIKSVLHNFLGTYMSRYTDYRGYWLFGFLVSEQFQSEFDLLDRRTEDMVAPLAAAKQLAAMRFEDQARKAGLDVSQVREAWLRISSSPDTARASVNGHPGPVFNLSFRVWAVMDNQRRYEFERAEFVAPHDPRVERRADVRVE
jgi:hypothetical protein